MPSDDFFNSTKLPILAFFPIFVLSLILACGPIEAPLEIEVFSKCEKLFITTLSLIFTFSPKYTNG